MRIIFMGTPEFCVPTLKRLAEEHDVIACYSQPPRPAGRRGLELTKSPVHQAAEALGIDVRTPISLKAEDEQEAFRALSADLAVVVAYGLLLPRAILEGTKHGCFNGHASLLPRWRGAAPLHRAIMAGDETTGMMVMKMDEGLDTGPVAKTEEAAIGPDMTTGDLHYLMAEKCASLMSEAMSDLSAGSLKTVPQSEEGVTYAHKIKKSETRVDLAQTAQVAHNHIRGLSPFPGAWCEMKFAGKWQRVKLLRSSLDLKASPLQLKVKDGEVALLEVQKAGAKKMSAQEFLRGQPIEDIR